MTSPDERATSGARNDAITLVESALESGRIVQADRDMRVSQLGQALTMQELDLIVRDLRAAAPAPPPTVAPVAPLSTGAATVTAPPPAEQPWPLVNYGPGAPTTEHAAEIAKVVSRGGRAVGGIIALVVLASVVVPIAGAIIAFVSARDSFPDFPDVGPTDDTTYLPGQAPGEDGVNVHTVAGYRAMVDALREESGATTTFNTVIYPRYAVLTVPTGVNDRYEMYYWDGESLDSQDSRGSNTAPQVDLDQVDPDQMITMLETVRARIDNPDSWYVNISGTDPLGASITAYASNDFAETTYIVESLDGTVLYDSDAAS